MANVLLGATGSVAAVRVPELYAALAAAGHTVKIVATDPATYFFDPAAFSRPDPTASSPLTATLFRDTDEWPNDRYRRGDPVLHIELRQWADLLAVAPLDANTLAKFATGLCDNCLTCVWRAWDRSRPVILAPAMNTLMWEHPSTGRHLAAVAVDLGAADLVPATDPAALISHINQRCRTLRIVPPVVKPLACGEVGVGGLADTADILQAVTELLSG